MRPGGEMRVSVAALAVLACGCYSTGILLDGTTDTGSETGTDAGLEPGLDVRSDAVPDPGWDPRADWTVPDGFGAVPEKPLVTGAVSSHHPSIAFTGSDVGLVYRGLGSTGSWSVAFIPLDGVGEVIGSERLLTSRGAAAEAIPRISSSDDGDFLVCALFEAERRLFVGSVNPAGDLLASAEAPYEGDLLDPLSAPVRIGDDVFVVAETPWPAWQVALFRFSYPGIVFEEEARMTSWDGTGILPVLMRDPVRTGLVVNSRHESGRYVAVEDIDVSTMYFTGAITTFGGDRYGNLVKALHASSSTSTWFGYTVIWSSEASTWQFFRFDPVGDREDERPFWYGPETGGAAVGEIMDSDTPSYAASAAAFAVHMDGQWQVWAHVIRGAGYGAPTGLFPVGLGASARPELPPRPTVAWTGDGFLVVWDKPVSSDLSGGTLASTYVEVD